MSSTKQYILSFAASLSHKPEQPERTAKRTCGDDVMFQVWSNRAAMAKSIRMQQSRAGKAKDWKPCVPLTDSEGY
jgi:hypothetical protein